MVLLAEARIIRIVIDQSLGIWFIIEVLTWNGSHPCGFFRVACLPGKHPAHTTDILLLECPAAEHDIRYGDSYYAAKGDDDDYGKDWQVPSWASSGRISGQVRG